MGIHERILKLVVIATLSFHCGGAWRDGEWLLAVSCAALVATVIIAWGMSPTPTGDKTDE